MWVMWVKEVEGRAEHPLPAVLLATLPDAPVGNSARVSRAC